MALLIILACILHNVCTMEDDLLDDLINMYNETREENNNNPHNHLDVDEEEKTRLLNYFPPLRNRQ